MLPEKKSALWKMIFSASKLFIWILALNEDDSQSRELYVMEKKVANTWLDIKGCDIFLSQVNSNQGDGNSLSDNETCI